MGFTCLGYLRGYLEGLVQAQAAGTSQRIYCPDNAKNLKVTDFRQWAAAFVKFVDAHPDRAHANAAETLAALVAQVAPCQS